MTTLLTPDQYMDLLLERQAEYVAQNGPAILGFPPLLDWFIRDGDEALVDMDAIEAADAVVMERPAPKPRRYRPASYWRDELDRVTARMNAISGVQRHATDDPAAYGGVGISQTARQRRKYGESLDRTAAEWVRLEARRSHAVSMLRKAEARERGAA